MDDLSQYSPRRRDRPEAGATGPFVSPLRFTLAPPMPLTGRRREPHAWRPTSRLSAPGPPFAAAPGYGMAACGGEQH